MRKAEGKRIQTFSSYCVQDSSKNQALEKHTAEFSEPAFGLQVQSFTSLSYIVSTTMAESQSILLGIGTACGNLWSSLQKNS